MEKRKTRVGYIDILRGIAIVLVLIGHIPCAGFSSEVHKWLYAFHIPLFFFVSGMSLSFKDYNNIRLKEDFKKRFNRIILPYLIWGVLLALPSITLLSIPKILYATHKSIASVSNSSLWFLPVLFFSTVALTYILHIFAKHKLTKLIPLLVVIFLLLASILSLFQQSIQSSLGGHNVPFGLDIVPMAVIFMLFGYLLQTSKIISKKINLFWLISLTVIMILLTTFFSINNPVSYVLMAENRYGNILYFLLGASSGIIACLLLSLAIDHYFSRFSKLMKFVGVNTMIIFITQRYPLVLLDEVLILLSLEYAESYLLIALALLLVLPICLFLSVFIKNDCRFWLVKNRYN